MRIQNIVLYKKSHPGLVYATQRDGSQNQVYPGPCQSIYVMTNLQLEICIQDACPTQLCLHHLRLCCLFFLSYKISIAISW